ncbi:MAG: CocE/NonD family hydrolase, partial [Actinobacteria bacterium]|nr:CocE/NonD family hydrolase [Actinomycetota bacterium]
MSVVRRTAPALLALALAASGVVYSATPGQAAPDRPAGASAPTAAAGAGPAARGTWKPRAEQYPGSVMVSDLAIPVSDGTVLRGDLVLPADASGQAVDKRFPVIVTITAYNKITQAAPEYLVRRGYAQLTVDARGTGSSGGQWNAFDARENEDAGEIMTWAHEQPWSNGRTAMSGPSY